MKLEVINNFGYERNFSLGEIVTCDHAQSEWLVAGRPRITDIVVIKTQGGKTFHCRRDRFKPVEPVTVTYPEIKLGKSYHLLGNKVNVVIPEVILSNGLIAGLTGLGYPFFYPQIQFHANYTRTIVTEKRYAVAYRLKSKSEDVQKRIVTSAWYAKKDNPDLNGYRKATGTYIILKELELEVESDD